MLFSPSIYSANCLKKLLPQKALQQIRLHAGFERAQNLNVSLVGCQDDDACFRKFVTNCDHRFNTAHVWHLQIHQREVRPVIPELIESLTSRGSLGDQFHVRLTPDQEADASPQHRMVVNSENPDEVRTGVHDLVPFSWEKSGNYPWS